MKILNNKQDVELKKEIRTYNEEKDKLNKLRTPFWVSVIWIILDVVLPLITLWLLTSPDIYFRIFNIEWYVAIGCVLIVLLFTTLITIFFYGFNGHNVDQFTFNYGLFGGGTAFYLSSFGFGTSHFLYQSLIAAAFFIVFLFIGTIIGVVIKNFKLKHDDKEALKRRIS